MTRQRSLRARRIRLRLRGAIAIVALVALAMGLGSSPLQRARCLLAIGQPEHAWEQCLRAPRSPSRDRLLVGVLLRVLNDEHAFEPTRIAAAATLACLAPAAAAAVPLLIQLAGRGVGATNSQLAEACCHALGWFDVSGPAEVRALVEQLMEAKPIQWPGPMLDRLEQSSHVSSHLARAGAGTLPLLEEALDRLLAEEAVARPADDGMPGPWLTLTPLDLFLIALSGRTPVESAEELASLSERLARLAVEPAPMHRRLAAAGALARLGERAAGARPVLAAALEGLVLEPAALADLRGQLGIQIRGAGEVPSSGLSDGALLEELEILWLCCHALGEPMRGAAPLLAARLRAAVDFPWVPPLVALYAAIETSDEAAQPVLRRLLGSEEVMDSVFAGTLILRHHPGDEPSLEACFTARTPRQLWQAYLHCWPELPAGRLPRLEVRGRLAILETVVFANELPVPRPESLWCLRGVGDALLGEPDPGELPWLLRFLQSDQQGAALVRLARLGVQAAPAKMAVQSLVRTATSFPPLAPAMAALAAIDPSGAEAAAELRWLEENRGAQLSCAAALACLEAGVAEGPALDCLRRQLVWHPELRSATLRDLAGATWRAHGKGRRLELGDLAPRMLAEMKDTDGNYKTAPWELGEYTALESAAAMLWAAREHDDSALATWVMGRLREDPVLQLADLNKFAPVWHGIRWVDPVLPYLEALGPHPELANAVLDKLRRVPFTMAGGDPNFYSQYVALYRALQGTSPP